MKRFALFAFAFAGLAACETPTSAPMPSEPSVSMPLLATISNESFPVDATLLNPCPPEEPVAVEGLLHVLMTGEETPPTITVKVHVNAQDVEGVGLTSGDMYRVEQNERTDRTISVLPPFEQQETDIRFRMIREGSEDNLWLRQSFRLTFLPFQIELTRNELECRG